MHVQHGFQPGDILARRIPGLKLLWHFGVLVGPDAVVHLGPGGVSLCTFDEFAAGQTVKEALFIRASDRAAAIARALSAVGTGAYQVLDNNCERFANWCATGEDNCGMQASLARLLLRYANGQMEAAAEHAHAEQVARTEAAQAILDKATRELEAMNNALDQRMADAQAKAMKELDEHRKRSEEFKRQCEEADREWEARMQALDPSPPKTESSTGGDQEDVTTEGA